MLKIYYFLLTLFVLSAFTACNSPQSAEDEILDRLKLQTECWNTGDLDCFMVGYWQSDSLMFIGGGGVIYGYANTLERYKTSYPDYASMGQLNFEVKHVIKISQDAYYVVGKYYLTREIGNAEGHYSLLWRLIDGQWMIVADHSSAAETVGG
jgi:hypothetical protein